VVSLLKWSSLWYVTSGGRRLRNETQLWWMWFHQVQHVPGSTCLLILEQHSDQSIRFEGQVYVKFRLTSKFRCFYSMLFTYNFPLILGITYGYRVGFGGEGIRTCRNVVPGSPKYVSWQISRWLNGVMSWEIKFSFWLLTSKRSSYYKNIL